MVISLFFGDIRIIESRYVMDKMQMKIFQFLLLSMVLRNTFDIYKLLSLVFLFFFLILNWLTKKRGDYLISRGSRDYYEHAKIMLLGNILIFISFIISYAFYTQFTAEENQEVTKDGSAAFGILDPFDMADMIEGNRNGKSAPREEKMGKIYVVIGFEFIRILLKGIQHNFRY